MVSTPALTREIVQLGKPCPACGGSSLRVFHEQVPWFAPELNGEAAAPVSWIGCLECRSEWSKEAFALLTT